MFLQLRDAFVSTLKNKRLLGFGFLEAGAILVFTILYYLLFLAILQIQLGVPTDVILNYFMNDALPQQANQTLLVGTIVYGLLIMVLIAFFESGIFSIISGKTFDDGIRSTGVFVVLAIFFEIAELALFLLITGLGMLLAFISTGLSQFVIFALLLLVQLVFLAWRVNARFNGLKNGPIVSFRNALLMIAQKPGLWARAVIAFVIAAVLIVIVVVSLLLLSLYFVPLLLIPLVLLVVAIAIITNLAFKMFMFAVRKSVKKSSSRGAKPRKASRSRAAQES